MPLFIIIPLMIVAAIFWLWQVVFLMCLSDDEFPGRFDKPLWVAILVFTFVLGALAFWFWKLNMMAERRADAMGHAIGGLIQKDRKPEEPQ